MKVSTAKKRLLKEQEFLGVEWDRLMYLFHAHPMMFSQGALNAYDVWLESVNRIWEDL
jgi:hypothetical protein